MELVLEWLKTNKQLAVLAGAGMLVLIVGASWWARVNPGVEIEILESDTVTQGHSDAVWVDVAGAVEKPGTYQLASDARLKDALAAAGGLAAEADRSWVARYVNLAQKVADGAKVYIPAAGAAEVTSNNLQDTNNNQSSNFKMININTASVGELDNLPGIGEVRARAIIDGRPYGDISELMGKGILPKSIFEKIKEQISVY